MSTSFSLEKEVLKVDISESTELLILQEEGEEQLEMLIAIAESGLPNFELEIEVRFLR